MGLSLIVQYSDIYQKEKHPSLDSLLAKTPSRLVIGLVSFINGTLHFNPQDIEMQMYFVNKLTERNDHRTRTDIINRFKRFIRINPDKSISIFTSYTMTWLIQWEIQNYRRIDFSTPSPEHEYNVLIAILIANSQIHTYQNDYKQKGKSIYEILWPITLPQLEFYNNRFFIQNLYFSIQFLSYLENRYPKEFSDYLLSFNVSAKNELLNNILELIINGYNKDFNYYNNKFSSTILDNNRILKSLAVDIETINQNEQKQVSNNMHFKYLRKHPLIKYKNGYFDVSNWGFVLNKLNTTALLFDFYYNSPLCRKKQFIQYKNDIGKEFSENILFSNIISRVFHDKNYIHITPDKNKHINVDYYLRKNNIIFLFEYKDYTVSDIVKNGSYQTIKNYIDKHFIETENGQKKGVFQLSTQIETLISKFSEIEKKFESELEMRRLIIFPIIIVKDNSFTLPGLNSYLKEVLLEKTKFYNKHFFLISALTIIELDTFISLEDKLINKELLLETLIHNYHIKIGTYKYLNNKNKNPESHFSSLLSFTDCIENKIILTQPFSERIFSIIKKELSETVN